MEDKSEATKNNRKGEEEDTKRIQKNTKQRNNGQKGNIAPDAIKRDRGRPIRGGAVVEVADLSQKQGSGNI